MVASKCNVFTKFCFQFKIKIHLNNIRISTIQHYTNSYRYMLEVPQFQLLKLE